MSTPLDSLVSKKAEMEVKKQNSEIVKEVANLDNLLEEYGGVAQMSSIANTESLNSATQTVIIDISKLLVSVYDNLKTGFNEGELQEYTDKVSIISSRYKEHPELERHMSKWRECRTELIKLADEAAGQLDKNFVSVNMARMFGSLIEILNSFNLDIYEKFCSIIASYAYNISPKLGIVTESVLKLAPHLRFMGFASSFFEILGSQIIINRVVEAMKKDKDLFKPLQDWFDETNEFEESVKKLFPHGISKEVVNSIDSALQDCGEEEKIFSATVISNFIKDSRISKDGKFLAKVFLFCRSDASKEWYRRMKMGDPPLDLEKDLFYFRTELQQLELTDIDSGSKIEIAKCTAEQLENSTKNSRSILGRLILCGMSGMSVYYCYENIKAGSRHRYSGRLRDLSTNAQTFLNKVERIRT